MADKIVPKKNDMARVIGQTPIGTVREIKGNVGIVVYKHKSTRPGRVIETIGEHDLNTLEVATAAPEEAQKGEKLPPPPNPPPAGTLATGGK